MQRDSQKRGHAGQALASSPSERQCEARCIYNTALKGTRPHINHTISLAGVKIATWHPAHACAWNRAGPANPSTPQALPAGHMSFDHWDEVSTSSCPAACPSSPWWWAPPAALSTRPRLLRGQPQRRGQDRCLAKSSWAKSQSWAVGEE